MCGIFLSVSKKEGLNHSTQPHIDLVSKRGPDLTHQTSVNLGNGFFMHFASFVLHLRGSRAASQPFEHDENILQWNGEIFGGLEIPELESDTKILSQRLGNCTNDTEICDLMRQIEGPWAFVYFQKSSKKLWFGRDYIGRRSLLFHRSNDEFILSSVGRKSKMWRQVPAYGIFCMDMEQCKDIVCYHWRAITRPKMQKVDAMMDDDKCSVISLDHTRSKSALHPPILTLCRAVSVVFPEIDSALTHYQILSSLLKNTYYHLCIRKFLETLRFAVKKRVTDIPKKNDSSASLGVLFSGGVDCTVLALVADEYVPLEEQIVLLNVAFETPKRDERFRVPDRITGRTALNELQALCPKRVWNFKEINVSLNELKAARSDVIADLTYPLVTVLDDSIGCALWFAARGDTIDPTSDTKVVLSGLGADEQLGGYSRHRAAFEKDGHEGFKREIMKELERISTRNLGRDDRMVAHHGKEARFPYLDENVISFLNRTPSEYKSNFLLQRGLGEKILLRAAAFELGLRETAVAPKRAIQFGSRIAKAEQRKEKASDICQRLL